MKKKRKANLSWFQTDDGRRVRFDWVRFHEEVDNRAHGRSQYKSGVFRKITSVLHPEYTRDDVEDKYPAIKKWYGGDNGPSNLLEICKPLAEFFGCEDDAFLEYDELEENKTMNMTTAQANTIPNLLGASESRMMINAMKRMKEKEVAHELYGVFVDLIAAYVPVDEDIWVEQRDKLDGISEWAEKTSAYPKRYPVEMAIQKTAPYLPKELRLQLMNLLEYMYGPKPFDWVDLDIIEYISMKHKQFEEYVKSNDRDPQKLDANDTDFLWCDMILAEEYDLFGKLDEIFSDYMCD